MSSLALVAPAQGARMTYGELAERVNEAAEAAAPDQPEGAGWSSWRRVPTWRPSLSTLGCLQAGLPVCLAEPQPEPLARLAHDLPAGVGARPRHAHDTRGMALRRSSQPGYVAAPRPSNCSNRPSTRTWRCYSLPPVPPGVPSWCGSPTRNLLSNASRIAEYLGLNTGERAVQSLPMHYSYGLSVLNSHLVAGGTVVLTPHSFMRPEFWRDADQERATSFAGVPYMYETLHRLRFDPARHPTLRTFTQAGGALRRDLIAHFHARVTEAGARLVVMYGQTEATARISYVPPERLGEKIGSIGIPIPGGTLRLERVEGLETGASELVYEGENVMLGYAESLADLGLGDVQQGVLRTGDLGTVDDEGFFTLVGRLKRFAKLFGRRVNLEDVERELESAFPLRAIATERSDGLLVSVVVDGALQDQAAVAHLARFLAVPPSAIVLRRIAEMPLTSAGKKDYKALEGAR